MHEGKELTQDFEPQIRGLFRVVAALIPGPTLKFPEANVGNARQPLETWEKDASGGPRPESATK